MFGSTLKGFHPSKRRSKKNGIAHPPRPKRRKKQEGHPKATHRSHRLSCSVFLEKKKGTLFGEDPIFGEATKRREKELVPLN